MKKVRIIIVSLLLLFIPAHLWCAIQKIPYAPYLMVGFIDSQLDLSVSIDESKLPIDFLDNNVKYNATPGAHVSGLRFGEFTIISNVNFTLSITHTPFTLKAPTENNNEARPSETIDYVLYAFTDIATGKYGYCYGTESLKSPTEIVTSKQVVNNKIINLVDYGLHLSLDDDADQTNALSLRTGIYESTILFVMETE